MIKIFYKKYLNKAFGDDTIIWNSTSFEYASRGTIHSHSVFKVRDEPVLDY